MTQPTTPADEAKAMTDAEPSVRAHLGKVLLPRHDSQDGWTDDEYTPDAARQLAKELNDAADNAYLQQVAIRRACVMGHQWGPGWNIPYGDKRTGYHCQREGCDGTKDEPGWLPFEPKDHHVPYAGVRACTGPGCEHCDNEAFAEQFQKLLSETVVEIIDPYLGERYQRKEET